MVGVVYIVYAVRLPSLGKLSITVVDNVLSISLLKIGSKSSNFPSWKLELVSRASSNSKLGLSCLRVDPEFTLN